jgi:threonine dehydratase
VAATVQKLEPPTFDDVVAARERIRAHLRPTLLESYPPLSRLLGAETWLKHENHLPTGAFKVRGGVNLVAQLDDDECERGLITASTGNHGQSIAFAGRAFGVTARICVPEGANQLKVDSIRSLGGEVIVHGRDFDEAREHCAALAREHGYRYVHSGDEPHLIAGVGTATLEILEEQPELDVLIVPIGGGSGAAGACVAGKALNPALRVIGVQSDAAPAAYRSWKERRLVEDEMRTFAEGLATRVAFELPQRILWEFLDDFVLVSDDDLRVAIVRLLETARTVAEPAGAAALAAALKLRDQLASKRVGLMLSGGNITLPQLRAVLAAVP